MDGAISVKRFLEQVKTHVEPRFASAGLVGEVSNLRAGGRHWYFTLKEEGASLSCAVWSRSQKQLAHAPADGDCVAVSGSLDVFVQGGSLTFVVTQCELAGAGDLRQRLRDLEARLRSEGVFCRPKRTPPRTPRKIAVIAALGGAALQDILEVTRKRAPSADILVFPAAAQGEACVPENIMALQEAQDEYWACDVVLMVRGGGSIEDLWGYNDPDLVRAVSECHLPIITGVGHEIDVTLVDLASDVRAATPSQAAEFATADRDALLAELKSASGRLQAKMDLALRRFETTLNLLTEKGLAQLDPLAPSKARLAALETRLKLAAPQSQLGRSATRLAMLRQRLAPCAQKLVESRKDKLGEYKRRVKSAVGKVLEGRRHILALLRVRLDGLNPAAPLERGFVLVRDGEGRHIKSSLRIQANDRLRLRWSDGEKDAVVGE
jgi:exodeoxyribonuclease VII large subunit